MSRQLKALAEAEVDEFADSGLFIPCSDPPRLRRNLTTEQLRGLAKGHGLRDVRQQARDILTERGLPI